MKEFLHSFVNQNLGTPFYISLAGITYPDASYHLNVKNRDITVIEYIISGEGYILIDGEYRKVDADTIYLLNQGEDHEYFADKKNPFSKIFLNISGPMAKELSSMYGLVNKHIFVNKELRNTFEKIPEILRSTKSIDQKQIELQLLLIEIFIRLSYLQSKQNINSDALTLKNYIDSNIHRIVSIKELSQIIFRSQDYCQKLFLKEFNITPYAYQINQKIVIAKNLLSNTDLSVSEIGASVGYTDPHYFSNIFKSRTGYSPKNYKNKINKLSY